jgi:hypothetical protein
MHVVSTDVVLAHGVSSRQDLPLPLGLALTGAMAALAVSFLALGLLWRSSRLRGDAAGRPLPEGLERVVDAAATRWALRLLGLGLVGFTAYAALAGPDSMAINAAGLLVYVVFWVGLVPASLLFGPVWRVLNPLRTIHLVLSRILRLDPGSPPFALPARLGYWPAAVSLCSFVWLELASPERLQGLSTLVFYFGLYAAVHVAAAICFGAAWFDKGDGFEVYSTLIGHLSVFGRRDDGRLVVRSPLANLDCVPGAPGLVAVVAIMLGSTAFDSVISTPWWAERTYDSSLAGWELDTLALIIAVLGVAAAFGVACWLAGTIGGPGPRTMPTVFAHSIVPIAVGYIVAHYFSLLVFAGQQALINASDPLADGSDLFGMASREIDYDVVGPTGIASVQVVAIVTGHVLGVFAAHDRALWAFARREAIVGQLPMMVLMIGYTFGGLSLLFVG